MTDEERRRLIALVRATCACQSCKDGVAEILRAEADAPAVPG